MLRYSDRNREGQPKSYRMLQLKDIDIHELGNQIQIAGVLMQGNGKSLAVYFAKSDLEVPEVVQMSEEDWKTFLHQVDTLEVKLFPHDPNVRTIVRKSQRNIEQGISWNVFRRDNYTCRYCAETERLLTVDHLVLWEDMGQSLEGNLISSCKKCNNTRGNKKFEDWIESDYYKLKIKNFADPEQAHKYNLSIWELAKKLPLRNSLRSR